MLFFKYAMGDSMWLLHVKGIAVNKQSVSTGSRINSLMYLKQLCCGFQVVLLFPSPWVQKITWRHRSWFPWRRKCRCFGYV